MLAPDLAARRMTPNISSLPMQGRAIAFQASAVAIEDRAVLITGRPGSGKSALALSLIDRGATLIGDDGVALSVKDDLVQCSPPPNIAGKLEIRGIGLVDMPTTSAPLALVIDLCEAGVRLPDHIPNRQILGHAIPCLLLADAERASLPLQVEWGLRLHGLPNDIV